MENIIQEDTGWLKLSGQNISSVTKVVKRYRDVVEKIDPAMWKGKKKHFKTYIPKFERELVDMVRDPVIVSPISKYLNGQPHIISIKIWNSLISPDDMPDLISTMQFHRDSDCERMIKVFIPLMDIAEENGPLVAVNAKESAHIAKAINYSFLAGPGYFVSDDIIQQHGGIPTPMVGKAGDVIMVDTCRCYHYGSRIVSGKNRLILAVSYQVQLTNDYGYRAVPLKLPK